MYRSSQEAQQLPIHQGDVPYHWYGTNVRKLLFYTESRPMRQTQQLCRWERVLFQRIAHTRYFVLAADPWHTPVIMMTTDTTENTAATLT